MLVHRLDVKGGMGAGATGSATFGKATKRIVYRSCSWPGVPSSMSRVVVGGRHALAGLSQPRALTPGSGHGICGYAASGSVAGVLVPFVGGGAEMAAVGVPSFGVVAGQPSEDLAAAGGASAQQLLSWRTSRLRAALNDSASALSALVPTAPIDWVTPRLSAEFREIL